MVAISSCFAHGALQEIWFVCLGFVVFFLYDVHGMVEAASSPCQMSNTS